jgi:CHAT domain-containing protein/Tfp pilus assembly protein PilF
MVALLCHKRVAWLAVLAWLSGSTLGRAALAALAQPVPLAEERTPRQRQQLEEEAQALIRQADQRYREQRLDQAVKLWVRVLQIRRQLYTVEQYPQGHPELAQTLNNLGFLLEERGELAQAEPLIRQALVMRQKLYPPERFPDGLPELAQSLNNLGALLVDRGELAQAEPCYRQALAMRQKLHPGGHRDVLISLNNLGFLLRDRGELAQAEPYLHQALLLCKKLYPAETYPDGHPHLVLCLNNVGLLLRDRGELGKAEPYYRRALAMSEKLYSKERFPDGHPNLAQSLNNLAALLRARGELGQAEPHYRRALAICQRLYPPERYPNGHPDLATCLNNLGFLLHARGELAQAEVYHRQTLTMCQRLYPAERYPAGHPNLASCLNNVGFLLQDQGELAQAEPYLRQALAMIEKLYSRERFPDGHPALAGSLNNLGLLLQYRGELTRAEDYHRWALAMCQRLYPGTRFPDGHPNLAGSLNNLGLLLYERGEPARAEPYLRQALAMHQRLVSALLAGSAETEALNYLTQLPASRDGHLSVTRALADQSASAYRAVWQTKGAVTRMLQQRRLSLLQAKDNATRELAADLAVTRQALAGLLRPGAGLRPQQAERVRALTDQKEKLEKQLADQLPLYKALQERLKREPAELLALLPRGAVFLDLTRYWHLEHDPKVPDKKGQRWTLSYVAFVLARGQPIRRVELAQAGPIDQALTTWRGSLQAAQAASPAADTLRRLLWRPLEKTFPAGTRTVLVAPDAALTGLPWPALPGSQLGRVLLEEYALAVVPDGQCLLDLLLRPAGKQAEEIVLAVGGIDYDRRAAAVALAPPAAGLARAPQPGKEQPQWAALPATAQELAQVERLSGTRPLIKRQGSAASTGQLLADLPQARWAHLATHGFFADPAVRSIFQLTAENYQRGRRGERIGVGARSPLVLSGLVCAGANHPVKDPEEEDGGILTAEAIAGLNLDGLELAVLSACETGLGESGGGEGVFGLQRAFHLAGARTVIASLWKVDDAATQALMAEFYRNLWERKLPRLEALRRAQLAMLLHYDAKAGRLRAPGAAVPVDPAELAAARQKLRTAGGPPLPPLYWAGFVLSGEWR